MMTEKRIHPHERRIVRTHRRPNRRKRLGFDCQFAGNVLTIEAADGTQIIVNRHTPNQELWIAAKSGGYHFAEQNGKWLATRDSRDFYDVLNEALSAASGEAVKIAEL